MKSLIALSLAIIGAGVGFLGDVMVWQGTPRAPVLSIAGLLVGLLLGWIVASSMPRSARTRSYRNHESQRMAAYRNRGLQRMATYRRG